MGQNVFEEAIKVTRAALACHLVPAPTILNPGGEWEGPVGSFDPLANTGSVHPMLDLIGHLAPKGAEIGKYAAEIAFG